MIRIYTAPSCASCRKVKAWLKEHQIPYVEKNIFSTLLRETELRELLERSENGTDDIISKRSKIIKENQVDLDVITIKDANKYISENQFAKGSMLPKVEASMSFVEDSDDRKAIISSLEKANLAIKGKTGTIIKRR